MTEQLFIYLDESGDLGFNFEKKGTPKHFVITLLVCKDMEAMRLIERAIVKTLKRKVNHGAKTLKMELKGTTTTLHSKSYFHKLIDKNPRWELYSVVLDKSKLSRNLDKIPIHGNLYNYLSRTIMEQIKFDSTLSKVQLIVDRSKNSHEVKEFNHYLSNHLRAFLPLDTRLFINHQTSIESKGLQAVDLFSWGVFKKYETRNLSWYDEYKSRITVEKFIKNKDGS